MTALLASLILASMETVDINWWTVSISFAGGLAMFLYGMDRMVDTLKTVAGGRLSSVLRRLTTNPFAGMLTGAGVTAVIQSSSVTTVLTIGFVSAGAMTLPAAIGVVLGANIGTTVTGQLVAFSLTTLGFGLVAGGYLTRYTSRTVRRRTIGNGFIGLGLLFVGMTVMSAAVEPLRDWPPFVDALGALENPLIAVAAGAAFTAIVQSSSATIAAVIVLAGTGTITPAVGIALVLGANIGTAITAVLAAIGKPPDAKRVAAAHVMFNVVGALVWLPFIDQLASFVAGLGGSTARQVANAHTLFNIINALALVGFAKPIARFVTWLVPAKPEVDVGLKQKYLDEDLISIPDLAFAAVRREMDRMARRVTLMLHEAFTAVTEGPQERIDNLLDLDDELDELYDQTIVYLGRVAQGTLTKPQASELRRLISVANNLESLGDLIEKELVELAKHRLDQGLVISDSSLAVLENLHTTVTEAIEHVIEAFSNDDEVAAEAVRKLKPQIRKLEGDAIRHHTERLTAPEPDRMELYRLETDVVEVYRRMYGMARRIAGYVTASNGES